MIDTFHTLAMPLASRKQRPGTVAVCLLSLLIVACGSSGGGTPADGDNGDSGDNGDQLDAAVCPGQGAVFTNPAVYLATPDGASKSQLFLADADNPQAGSEVLNGPMSGAQEVQQFALGVDGRCVFYVADERIPGQFELFSVDIANPGQSARLNAPLPTGSDVSSFAMSPDSRQLAYRANGNSADQQELFLVDVTQPGIVSTLSDELVAGGNVFEGEYLFNPNDGSSVLYLADQREDGRFELFLVQTAEPGESNVVNQPLADFTTLATGAHFSPDGLWIGYLADHDTEDARELYLVDIGALGVATRMNPPYQPDQDMCSFEFRPDSQQLGYCADQDTDGKIELYAVDIGTPGVSVKLNSPIVSGGEVRADFAYHPDSTRVFYRADQDINNRFELYRVELAKPGISEKLNEPLVDLDSDVDFFRVHPDGSAVAYVADQETVGVYELYEADSATPPAVTKLGPERVGNDLFPADYSADGTFLLYVADELTEDVQQLFRIDRVAPGVSTRISATLGAGGDVSDFDMP